MKYPLQYLYIYATKACNLSCKHCWLGPLPTTEQVFLNTDIIQDIVQQAIPLGLRTVRITGGEPLLRPDFVDILRILRNWDLTIQLETNGTLIDLETALELVATSTHVTISLDSSSPQYHDEFRGVQGAFDAAIAGIKLLKSVGGEPSVVMSICRDNVEQIPSMIQLCEELHIRALKINPIIALGNAADQAQNWFLSIEELLHLRTAVTSTKVNVFLDIPCAFRPITQIIKGISRCPFLNLLSLLPNGNLSFCGLGFTDERWVLGHVHEVKSIEEFWLNNPVLCKQRDGLPSMLTGICGNCIFQSVCQGGCRAHAMSFGSGDFPPDPLCQMAYEAGLFPPNRMKVLE